MRRRKNKDLAPLFVNRVTSYPKISIVMPTLNQGSHIEKAISSVIDQDYPYIELIIIDGGSSDKTVGIIKRYASRIAYWCSEPDSGQAEALNKGFAKATGEIFAWLNSDDWYTSGALHAVAKLFAEKNADIVVGNCVVAYTDGRSDYLIKTGDVSFRRLVRYWNPLFCPPQPAIFFKRLVFESVGPLDDSLDYAMDLDLWLRMSINYRFTYADSVFAYYLLHSQSKSGLEGYERFEREWEDVCKRHVRNASLIDKVSWYIERLVADHLR